MPLGGLRIKIEPDKCRLVRPSLLRVARWRGQGAGTMHLGPERRAGFGFRVSVCVCVVCAQCAPYAVCRMPYARGLSTLYSLLAVATTRGVGRVGSGRGPGGKPRRMGLASGWQWHWHWLRAQSIQTADCGIRCLCSAPLRSSPPLPSPMPSHSVRLPCS
jgi:hypothetical protein